MNTKTLINQLQLACSPISNFEFQFLKNDIIIQRLLKKSNIYIIGQRPELSFENITFDIYKPFLHFEIHQKSNSEILKVTLPLLQENIVKTIKGFGIEFGSHDKANDITIPSFKNIQGLKLFSEGEFITWFSPEKFLQNYWWNFFSAKIDGNFRSFTKYLVHYIGKSTDQDIWERLTGHATLQEILSIEYPFNYGTLPTHEIALLFFCFYDNFGINTFDTDSEIVDMANSLLGKDRPEIKTIFLDAEKALIKAMQPKYNKEVYKNYPKSSDGLFKHKLDAYAYTFIDPISLLYNQGTIEGGLTFMGGDTIVIENNESMKILKA